MLVRNEYLLRLDLITTSCFGNLDADSLALREHVVQSNANESKPPSGDAVFAYLSIRMVLYPPARGLDPPGSLPFFPRIKRAAAIAAGIRFRLS